MENNLIKMPQTQIATNESLSDLSGELVCEERKFDNWINTKDCLPEAGKYVLARHNRGTWIDSDDQSNVNCVVVKLEYGISQEQRKKMKTGELPDEIIKYPDGTISRRSNIYRSEDEEGNNEKPYCWQQFGPDKFFGQTITHWLPIPPLTIKR
jgi:hypothetical protein